MPSKSLNEITASYTDQVHDQNVVDLDDERGRLKTNPGAKHLDETWNRRHSSLEALRLADPNVPQ